MHNPIRMNCVLLVVLAMGFAVAHTQSPLFYSNQNQYLLHGLAAGGYGHLSDDWLANTKDPTPLFSLGVQWSYQVAGLWPLQAAYFVLLMVYFSVAWWWVCAIPGVAVRPRTLIGFAALFTAAHAAILRWASVQPTGKDYPWFLQSGVAGQYILGPGLQPSVAGLFLFAGLAAFANHRPWFTAVLSAFAVAVHPTYALPAALLTTGFVLAPFREKKYRLGIGVGALTLLLTLPTIAYVLSTFPPTSAETFAEAQQILARVRIPHHAIVSRWLDIVALLQVAWIATGIMLLRKSRLFIPLVVAAAGSLLLTLAQLANASETAALLFPWRVSAVLVPAVTAAIAARVIAGESRSRVVMWVSLILCVGLVVGGISLMVRGIGYATNEAEQPMLDFVRTQVQPGEVYLIPTRIPAVGSGRGSMSASFTPPPRPKPGTNLIPVDLQRFRLATGAPIYVDFKSVPYADWEVLEWHRRIRLVEQWYATPDWDQAGIRNQLLAEKITHVVISRDVSIHAEFLERTYSDDVYRVYRVQ